MNKQTNESKVFAVNNYKDTVFRMLFADKKELLQLYNGMNGTSYNDPEALQITTLDSAVFMTMKNDVSFVLDMRLSLYEQQASVNPNMPLRNLFYVSKVYEGMIVQKDLYSKKRIRLPAPSFITFYNGTEVQPERTEYYLSDSYRTNTENPNLELRVIQLNINPGYNEWLKEKCPTLCQYMQYVDCVRRYAKDLSLPKAVENAVNECIAEGILAEFFLREKAMVISMSIFEFDQELHNRTLREEGFEDGYAQGAETVLISQICRKLQKNKSPEVIADELEEDIATIQPICDVAATFAPEYDVKKIYDTLHERDSI